MPLPTLTTLPTAPSRTDSPSVFNTNADAFLGALPNFQSEMNAVIAAIPAAVNGIDYNGTSTTSVAIGTGSKSFTTQTGKNFQVGQPVRVAYTTTPANYMDGQVTSYNSSTGALVVNVTAIGGTGTFAVWTIALIPGGGSSYATLTGVETLTSKTLTTPVLSATASGTTAGAIGYSAGVFSGGNGSAQLTFATTTSTQTLTNKTIDTASTNVIKVNGNTLAASAGTATITFPNSSDTLVGRATTDTLTNKTLTAPTIASPSFSSAATSTFLAVASAAGGASVNLPHGSAPSAPNNGDLWTTTAGLFARVNGTTQQVAAGATLAAALAAMSGISTSGATVSANTINWPITLPDGSVLRIQGGSGSLASGGSATITFSNAYTTAPVVIVGGGSISTSHQGDVHISANPTTTGVSILSSSGGTAVYNWIAIGI